MTIQVLSGDITQQDVDAIVNAANSQLAGGGGVDGAIHRAAGPTLMAECNTLRTTQGGCAAGSAVITGPGLLKARYVIHAVGPVWHGGSHDEDALLAAAYQACFALAEKRKLTSLAFPNISTGIYGFPKTRAAKIVAEVTGKFKAAAASVQEIRFVCFDRENLKLYQELFHAL